MVAVANRRQGPDEDEYACFQVHSRSSSWISQTATVRHFYHDTERWSDIQLPLCKEDGAMYTSGGRLRLERALALAWHPRATDGDECRYRATLRHCDGGIVADNVQWEGVVRTDEALAAAQRPSHSMPPSLERVARLAPDCVDAHEIAVQLRLKMSTVWNYLAKAAARDALLARAVRHLVDPRIVVAHDTLVDVEDHNGSLRELMERMTADVTGIPDCYNQLRLLRL